MSGGFAVTWAGGSVRVEAGTLLSRALNSKGIVETPCGGRGRCLKCLVQVVSGDAPRSADDLASVSADQLDAGFRLACRLPVTSDMRVAVTPFTGARVAVAVPEPAAGPYGPKPCAERATGLSTVGFALDLGTTTLAGSLVDLGTGERIAAGARSNPQSQYGADVISRLAFALKSSENALALRESVLHAARELFASLCASTQVSPEDVRSGVMVANTAMHHLALGLDVSGLARAPYRPAAREAAILAAPGLPPLYAAPVIAGFAGSDAVADAVSSGILRAGGGPRLLIDLGTNTEVLLKHEDRLLVASAPAGPAFEGGEISQGMLAVPGAVESVRFDPGTGGLLAASVGGAPALGICGSGLIDAVAALLQAGMLDEGGRVCASGLSAAPGVRIAPGVYLTQKDVRAFQLAKGAVRAAIDSLLDEAGLACEDLTAVLLAGMFGTCLNPGSAVATGLLPPVDPGIIRPLGNAALAGAEMILLSREAKDEAEQAASSAVHIELALRPGFQEMFLEALQFRMPQGSRQPSVPGR